MGALSLQDVEEIPQRVQRTLTFLRENRVWHVVSRNSPATSCQDAANRRFRLGKVGIPLYDEMKSLHLEGCFPGGERHFVLLHCRAHARFDLQAAERMLGVERPLQRLTAEELSGRFSARYGTVNPFSEAAGTIQLFDEDLLSRYSPPHSVMTNAGDLTWAVEFRPVEVIAALKNHALRVEVARITTSSARSHSLPVFGIITGNGPESGMSLWKLTNRYVHAQLTGEGRMHGDLTYPRVHIHSIPEMGLSMELIEREEEVWAVIRQTVERFIAEGVTHIAIACNTTQYFAHKIRELCEPQGVTFVALAEVMGEYLRSNNLTEDVTILGIPVVAELGPRSAFSPLKELGLQPVREVAKAHLEELGYMVKRLEADLQDTKALNKLIHIVRAGVPTRRVMMALTEISVLLERFPRLRQRIADKEIIDTLDTYAKALARIYLNALPTETFDDLSQWD
ncbi:MAG: aspartate/glutamate racemase family protein [Magnetococcales bacterium]|nr:aspartate/glutamate racemase family protein [Magnetococcales bacterium]